MFPERHPPILRTQPTPPKLLPERQTQPRGVQKYRLHLLRIRQTLLGDLLRGNRALWPHLIFGHNVEGLFGIGRVRAAGRPRTFHYGAGPDPRHFAWVHERLVQLYHTHDLLGSVAE